MADVLARIEKNYTWLLGYTKKIQERFPGAYYHYSEEDKAWQIFSADNKLLVSIGFSIKNNDIVYMYLSDSGMKGGRTKNLKDLVDIYPKIGGQ
jgi:hypothetical protein